MSSLILAYNYLGGDYINTVTSSSENASFPFTNLLNYQRRTKTWRTGGYYELDSTNNFIVFQETSSVDLTATLTTGAYTSFSALATEIKTQLEAVGGSTYTVTQDTSTLKIKISSDGAGGGGIFSLRWSASVGMAGILGYHAVAIDTSTDDVGALTYTADFLRINSGEWILIDAGLPINPDAVALISRRNNPIFLTSNATIKIQGSHTDAWTTPSFSQNMTISDSIVHYTKDGTYDGIAPEEYRFWRIKFEDLDNPLGYLEFGSGFFGLAVSFDRGAVQIPFNARYLDQSITVTSEGGQTFSDPKQISEEFSLEIFGLTKADKEDYELFFQTVKTTEPFFIQLDPKSAMGTDNSQYFRFVKMTSAPSWEMPFPGVFSVSMDVREEL